MKTGKILLSSLFLLLPSSLLFASYPRAGYEAHLSTIYHNVSGTVTIVDANTLLVENFYYDGGGLTVYFYLGERDLSSDFETGLGIGPELSGTMYNNEQLIIHLPGDVNLDDYTAISVWCVDATVNFGSGSFIDRDPAVSWTFDNQLSQSYILDSFEPNNVPLGQLGAEDPTLLLNLGQRYEVAVLNYAAHPFEVIAKDANSSGDTVLLSMASGVNPSWETDSRVGWTYDGQGTAAFTLTPKLYNAMTDSGKRPGYRCGIHVSTMRGDFDVCLESLEGDLDGDCDVDLFDFAEFAPLWLEDNIAP